MLAGMWHLDHSHRGQPINPTIIRAPMGVLKPFAMTFITQAGAARNAPDFHAAPPAWECPHMSMDRLQ